MRMPETSVPPPPGSSYWKTGADGTITEEDRNAYRFTVETLRTLRVSHAQERAWYFQMNDEIFGPLPLCEVETYHPSNATILVCHDRMLKWVKLADINE